MKNPKCEKDAAVIAGTELTYTIAIWMDTISVTRIVSRNGADTGRNGEKMMDEEEYRKTLIRMFDSLRKEDKGLLNCSDVKCDECPLNKRCDSAAGMTLYNLFEILKAVDEWGKAHPIETNEQHFIKAFGYKANINCFFPTIHGGCNYDCPNCRWYKNSEYHAPEETDAE